MKTYNVIRLRFLSPLHIGEGKDNYDFSSSELHSDTLSAALAAIKAERGANSEEIAKFLSSFTLSSAFPFFRGTYYLPRLAGKMAIDSSKEEKLRKRLKKIRYVDSKLWSQSVLGNTVNIQESWLHGSYLSSEYNDSSFIEPFVNQVSQRVSVPRDNKNDAEPFFFEWRFFHSEAGLYCITDAAEGLFDELCSLFRDLGDFGLGTDKNIGGGHFVIETDTIQLPDVKDANATVLLSLYLPQEYELNTLNLSDSRYNLILRGGFMAGSTIPSARYLLKKSVYMFTEGSVLSTNAPIEGAVVNLQPEWADVSMHPVFRSGRAFSLPIKQCTL